MLKPFALATLVLLALPGCQATPVQPATAAPAAASKASAPKTISASQMRRVLADGGATIWGLTYTQSYTREWGRTTNIQTYRSEALLAGGTLVKADYNRYVYQVPDDRVLVLNRMRGGNKTPQVPHSYQGTITMNGFAHAIDGDEVYYVFGPGEMVVFALHPTIASEHSGSGYYYNAAYPMSISGYTASPSLFAGVGGGLGGK